jgi:hypothetical protein
MKYRGSIGPTGGRLKNAKQGHSVQRGVSTRSGGGAMTVKPKLNKVGATPATPKAYSGGHRGPLGTPKKDGPSGFRTPAPYSRLSGVTSKKPTY